jgi:hypothetical protein
MISAKLAKMPRREERMNPRMDTNEHECKPLLLMLLPSFVFIRVHSWTSSFCWRSWRLGALPDATGCYRALPDVTAHAKREERTHLPEWQSGECHWSLVTCHWSGSKSDVLWSLTSDQ